MKTIDGRYINKYLAKVSRILKAIVANTPFEGVERYMEISKNETTKNINELQMRGDDIPFKKSYVFH